MKLSKFISKYKHAYVMLYLLIYFPWFFYLEKTVTSNYHVIYMKADDYIPFIEYFIVPYLLWFFFVAATVAYFFFNNTDEFFKLTTFLFTGMTVFLIVSTIYPNGHTLRPATFANESVFTMLIRQLYRADTPTNLFPSIHVYNSIGCYIAISHNQKLRNIKWLNISSFVLTFAIILSTVFLKQHSLFDVITAFIMALVLYVLVYRTDHEAIHAKLEKRKVRRQLT